MTHPRKTIRDKVVALLLNATAAEGDVYPARRVPWRRIELPGIGVAADEETSASDDLNGDLVRHASVTVTAVAEATEAIEDVLDALALEIETVLGADPTLGGVAFDSVLTGTVVDVSEGAEKPVGAIQLTYDVEYHTASNPSA